MGGNDSDENADRIDCRIGHCWVVSVRACSCIVKGEWVRHTSAKHTHIIRIVHFEDPCCDEADDQDWNHAERDADKHPLEAFQ